jgi:hypothetical protein
MRFKLRHVTLSLIALTAVTSKVGLGLASEAIVDGEARFPRLIASNLEKRSFTLPDDFEGSRNLLLVAFQREQQQQVDTWLREMRRFEELDPEFRYYELPTIQSPNRLVRWFIDTGMRRGIPDQKARSRTITLYIDKQPFLKALGITDENRIHCFLVNRSGQILWRVEGGFDDAKAVSLRERLQSLVKPPSVGLK